MHKLAMVNARIEPRLKKEAEIILHEVGLTSAEAVRLLYKQICLQKGLPFEARIPNHVTVKAMQEADKGDVLEASSIDEIFEGLI